MSSAGGSAADIVAGLGAPAQEPVLVRIRGRGTSPVHDLVMRYELSGLGGGALLRNMQVLHIEHQLVVTNRCVVQGGREVADCAALRLQDSVAGNHSVGVEGFVCMHAVGMWAVCAVHAAHLQCNVHVHAVHLRLACYTCCAGLAFPYA